MTQPIHGPYGEGDGLPGEPRTRLAATDQPRMRMRQVLARIGAQRNQPAPVLDPLLRIVNTHLEYHSVSQRDAQIRRLLDLQEEASNGAMMAKAYKEPYAAQTLAASSLLCGDFNFDVSDRQHALIAKSDRPGLNYRDAWSIRYPGKPHALTCGLYDHEQWSEGPDCRDFIFATEDLAERVRRVEVNTATAASDHQPIVIELAD